MSRAEIQRTLQISIESSFQLNTLMFRIIEKLIKAGTTENMPSLEKRAIVLTNSIAVIGAVIISSLLLYSLRNGWSFFDQAFAITIAVLISIPLLNGNGLLTLGRFLLVFTIPVSSLVLSFLPRIQAPESFDYSQNPALYAVLLATSSIPILIFQNRDKYLMRSVVALNFVLFLLVDPFIHFFSKSHEWPSFGFYVATNLIFIAAYLFLLGSIFSLKNIVDSFETKNHQLIEELSVKNTELQNSYSELYELNKNVETQNEEIQSQSENLLKSQTSLIEANNEIERQKKELEKQNTILEKSLDERSTDLLQTNEELVTRNNELQQFSYTVSHNLRGPVASMLGLFNIHQTAKTPEDKNHIFSLLSQSALSLDTIIRDLNKIVDIRNDKFAAFEEVHIQDELTLIQQSLHSFIIENDVEIIADLQCEQLHSIKAYINSILYNLISNAIQYRSPARKLVIHISSRIIANNICLEVSDNGRGIDLNKFKHDLFKLFKRFHANTQGKGLGLYLIKQQVEKLQGTIEVTSTPEVGTTFKVTMPK
ncbi:MAG: sensor histidine kinase [Cyclobacteriaceae bacterium]